MIRRLSILTTIAALATLTAVSTAFPATINFSGTLRNVDGTVVQGGRVIAGTFKPGFDINQYVSLYDDGYTNPDPNHYEEAVANGNFIPFNTGVLTNTFGVFSGSGSSSATGAQIWLYAFPTSATTSGFSVLASGSDSSFTVPVAFTNVSAVLANQFIFGLHTSDGFKLTGLPFPEPSVTSLIAISAVTLCMFRREAKTQFA